MSSTLQAGRGISRFLLGIGLTLGFYACVNLPVMEGTILHRYTTGHPVEYLSVGLFCIAAAELLLKFLGLGRQARAARYDWLPSPNGPQPITTAVELYGHVSAAPDHWKSTFVCSRLIDALHDVREKRSAAQLEEHLRYLAEQEENRCHASYATVRVIAWMIPILGFLGTVIGITLAIANITPSQLETSLQEVTGGLAIAFDTTALALSLSIGLMLMLSLVEGAEQKLLLQVERYVHRELAYRFQANDVSTAPYLAHLQATGESVIDHTRKMVEQQAHMWSRTVAALHSEVHQSNTALEQRLHETIDRWQSHFQHQGQSLAQAAVAMASVQENLDRVSKLLVQVVDGEGQLLQSQKRLADNLTILQQTQAFDEALNSLTAAIHLMTIRHQPHSGFQKNVA